MTEMNASGVRWWLWPNVLAFDAPVVAVVWQRFLAGVFGVTLPVAASVVLALVVWGIYLTDRRLDGLRTHPCQPRHRFAATHSKLIAALAVVSFLVAGSLAITLPWPYLIAGAIIAVLVAVYLSMVHLFTVSLAGRKELLVGVLFAAGVAIPLIASDVSPSAWLASVIGFGLTCWLNCRLIERWESRTNESVRWLVVLGIAIIGCSVLCPWPVGIALAAATALLLVLHFVIHPIGPRLALVLADVALLTPVFVWFLSSRMWME